MCLHHASSYKKSLTMSILKYLVILNHGILHVIARVKTKQLTTGYILLKCILKLHANVLYTMSKDLKRNPRNSSKSYFENNSSWYYEQWFQFTTSYYIDDLQKKVL